MSRRLPRLSLTLSGLLLSLSLASHASAQGRANPGTTCAAAEDSSNPIIRDSGLGFVSVGQDGWMFYGGHFVPPTFVADPVLPYVQRLSQALSAKGITLVIAPVPVTPEVYPEKLDLTNKLQSGYRVDDTRRAYQNTIAALRARGVVVVDLLDVALKARESAPNELFFFKTDHHWTTFGAKFSAQAVADLIKQTPGYARLPKQDFVTAPIETVEFYSGSLANVEKAVCNVEPRIEKLYRFRTKKTSAEGGLTDDTVLPVVLVGTSNSKAEDWKDFNMLGYLQQELALDVLNAAVDGGGLYASLKGYLLSDAYRQSPPSYVVWEFGTQGALDAEIPLREIIPSVSGSCSGASVLAKAEGKVALPDRKLPLFSTALPASITGHQHYLHLKFDDLNVKTLSLDLTYGDGGRESVTLGRSDRLSNTGEYFLELSDRFTGNLAGVELQTPGGQGSAVTAELCRA